MTSLFDALEKVNFRGANRIVRRLDRVVYDLGVRVYEVGSYAYRPRGFLGEWQVYIRLTPRDGGRKTVLWTHREYSPWRRPASHCRSAGYSAADGVAFAASLFASDDPFRRATK